MAESEHTSTDSLASNPPPDIPTASRVPAMSDNHHVPITSHKLNGNNYLQWSQSMMMFISGRSKEEYLTGAPPKTDPSSAKYKFWKVENNQVMTWLISSMTAEIGENFLLYATAKDIWEATRDTFSSSENTSELFYVESSLQDLRQGENSATVYFTTLTRHWQQLDLYETHDWKCPDDRAYFKKIVETKRVFKFLMGLDKSLDEVRGRILGAKPLPSLREAFSKVRREESRKRVMLGQPIHPTIPEIPALAAVQHELPDFGAFAARGNFRNTDNNRARRGRPWCDYCRSPGHLKGTCWKLNGKPADWRPNRDREARGNTVTAETPQPSNSVSFTKDQLELLQQLMQQINLNSSKHNPTPGSGLELGEDDWQC